LRSKNWSKPSPGPASSYSVFALLECRQLRFLETSIRSTVFQGITPINCNLRDLAVMYEGGCLRFIPMKVIFGTPQQAMRYRGTMSRHIQVQRILNRVRSASFVSAHAIGLGVVDEAFRFWIKNDFASQLPADRSREAGHVSVAYCGGVANRLFTRGYGEAKWL